MLFLQSYAIQPAPQNKPCIFWRVFLFLSCRVSLAKYIRVLRVYPTMLQVKFSACWRWWLTAGGLGDSIFISRLYAIVGGCYCQWDVVGSLPRGMPTVVDYRRRCTRRRSRWWHKRNTGFIQVRAAYCVTPYVLHLCELYWCVMRSLEGSPCSPYIVRGARLQI
jgi:hypothetical protein